MSVQQEHATSETATLTTTESGGVYQSLFDKINLTPGLFHSGNRFMAKQRNAGRCLTR